MRLEILERLAVENQAGGALLAEPVAVFTPLADGPDFVDLDDEQPATANKPTATSATNLRNRRIDTLPGWGTRRGATGSKTGD